MQIRGDSYVNSATKFDYDLRSNEAVLGQFDYKIKLKNY
jgi:hypothetical protein